jgi:tetratricopeptide (TPR) repeat protein
MPELISEHELRGGPGVGARAFASAPNHWNHGRHDQAATDYCKALEAGLSPAYEAGSRSNLGKILLKQGKVKDAIVQFTKALQASPLRKRSKFSSFIRHEIILAGWALPAIPPTTDPSTQIYLRAVAVSVRPRFQISNEQSKHQAHGREYRQVIGMQSNEGSSSEKPSREEPFAMCTASGPLPSGRMRLHRGIN